MLTALGAEERNGSAERCKCWPCRVSSMPFRSFNLFAADAHMPVLEPAFQLRQFSFGTIEKVMLC